jgi:hypothetical protein
MHNWIRIKGRAYGLHDGEVNLRVNPSKVIIFDKYEALEHQIDLQEGEIVVMISYDTKEMFVATTYEESPDLAPPNTHQDLEGLC